MKMKQVQLRSGGEIVVAEVEPPAAGPNRVLLTTRYSLVSPGTELGLIRTVSPDQPFPLGYSAAGAASDGRRFAAYGGPYTHHASVLSVPVTLAAPVADGVSDQEAAFGGLGTIAVHSVRQARLQFGETCVVVGLGLLGNLIAQVAQAAGYQVIGTDPLPFRREAATALGIETLAPEHEALKARVLELTGGLGADAVLVCAGGGEIPFVDQAIDLLRVRGKVVIVGNVSLNIQREPMFQKEAEILIARAGGPGRYDPVYERDGIDYPAPYVRWTEGRNLAEFIRLVAAGLVRTAGLITHIFPVDEAPAVYRLMAERPGETLGVLLRYD